MKIDKDKFIAISVFLLYTSIIVALWVLSFTVFNKNIPLLMLTGTNTLIWISVIVLQLIRDIQDYRERKAQETLEKVLNDLRQIISKKS